MGRYVGFEDGPCNGPRRKKKKGKGLDRKGNKAISFFARKYGGGGYINVQAENLPENSPLRKLLEEERVARLEKQANDLLFFSNRPPAQPWGSLIEGAFTSTVEDSTKASTPLTLDEIIALCKELGVNV